MILRKSLKNVIRSRGKTVLFFVLIFAVTMVTVLGAHLWDSVGKYLDDCDKNYLTIGLLEYMSPEYPDETVFDPGIRSFLDGSDFSKITSLMSKSENVLQWDQSERALGYIEGFKRFDSAVPNKLAGVIVVGGVSDYTNGGVKPYIREILYSYNYKVGNTVFLMRPDEWTEDTKIYDLKPGRVYVLHGDYEFGGGGIPRFWLKEFTNATAERMGALDGINTFVQDITDAQGSQGGAGGADGEDGAGNTDEKYVLPEDSIFRKIGRVYEVVNNGVDVYATGNVEALPPFQQQQLYIVEGRVFDAQEYANGEKVCIVTGLIAEKCGVGVGDEIPLSIAVGEDMPVSETYWPDTGFKYENKYRIVGITNNVDRLNHYVFIPKSEDTVLGANQIGYTIGQVILKNGKADDFYREIEPLLSGRLKLTIYDQGYAAASKPFRDILLVVKIITIVSIMLGVAVIAMFGFLFVYRQRVVSETMISLGAGKARVLGYFGSGSFVIAFFAAGLGAAAGFYFSDITIKLINWIVDGYLAPYDFYSNSRLTVVKSLEFAPEGEPVFFAVVAGVIVILAVLSCLIYTFGTFRAAEGRRGARRRTARGQAASGQAARGQAASEQAASGQDDKGKPVERQARAMKERRSSVMRGGALKYSVLSIRRGGLRSLIVPAVSVVIVLFLCQLASTSGSYARKLQDIFDSTEIRGQFTDPDGRQSGNLLVEAYLLNELLDSGYIRDLKVFKNFHYQYMGRSVADGVPAELPPFEIPVNPFAAENLYNKILLGDTLVFTNDLRSTTEFLFSDTIVTEFADGYDETFLADPTAYGVGETAPCMLPADLMEVNGILLGDTIRVAVPTDSMWEYDEVDLMVVGSFEKQGLRRSIYLPLGAYIDPELLSGEPDIVREQLFGYKLQSAVFAVEDATRLEDFRNYLFDSGYSQVRNIGPVRFFVVLEDRIFNNTVSTLKQQIRYINILYPFLYLMVGVIGVVVSYLLVVIRRKEIVIMRGLGARKGRVFMSFFFEQAVLCTGGCLAGLAVWALTGAGVTVMQLYLVGGFAAFFFAGAAFSVRRIIRDGGNLN